MRAIKMTSRILAAVLTASLLLTGCASGKESDATQAQKIEETTTEAATVAVSYEPAVPGNGQSTSLNCKDSYNDTENGDAVVAKVENEQLTNRVLRIYYAMELAAWDEELEQPQPDWKIPLYAQECPLEAGLSWEHFFLNRALETWHTSEALLAQSRQKQVITEKNYKAEPTTHEQFFPDTLPAYPVAYIDKDSFTPNELHQAYLDQLPETLAELSSRLGYADADALAKALAGDEASAKDLEDAVYLYNFAYSYFTELSYAMTVTEEEIEAYLAAHPEAGQNSEMTVTILHSLMIPEGARVSASGKVSASEEVWETYRSEIDKMLTARKKDWVTNHNPENTFSMMANQNSADLGTRADGGRYVSVRKGQLNSQIEDWAFAPERKYADVEVIRTDMGYEILFFKESETVGHAQARLAVLMEQYRAKVAELKALYPMAVDYSKIGLVGSDITMTPDDILYPDIAHERYPEMMLYLQQDYAPAPFGKWQVSRHGCGITTFGMVATYLSDTLQTPGHLAKVYAQFATPNGTDGNIFDRMSPDLGFYCEKKCWDWESVEQALNDGKIVVTLQYHGYFTKTGHYLAMIRMTDDGKVVIRDSNIYNYARLPEHKEDAFDPQKVIANSSLYWIFEPKLKNIAACSRCGDPKAANMPEGLLRDIYICEKCQTALVRRDGFLYLNT